MNAMRRLSPTQSRALGIRWTLGDVSERGFEALRLSIWGAWKIFGDEADYAVCVNSLPLDYAMQATGEIPDTVMWYDATRDIPEFLRAYFDRDMAEGVGWKLAPLRFFPDRYELCLDNDCILTSLPAAIKTWIERADGRTCVMAEDVAVCFGQFADMCPLEPRNAGIRGLPPQFDFEQALRAVLEEKAAQFETPLLLTSETDEQGLQTAALSRECEPLVVAVDEVTICSPFPPHVPYLGKCGAHFVGLNARQLPWSYDGRPATDYIRENWRRHRRALYDKIAPPHHAAASSV